MIKVKSLKVNLPTDVPAAQKEKKEDFISISIKEDGTIQIDKDLIPNQAALLPKLQSLYAANHDQRFLISATRRRGMGTSCACSAACGPPGSRKSPLV